MSTRLRILPLFIVVMVMLACKPLSTPTAEPASSPSALQPSPKPPTPTTAVEMPTPTNAPPPTQPVPQPAAAPYFHLGDPVHLDSISMVSRTEGWGISSQYILVTGDGGQTWREATPPEEFSSGSSAQAYGAFFDAHTAWILFAQNDLIPPEASIWITTDGGRNWTKGAPLFHQVFSEKVWAEFSVLDAQNLWVMVRGVYAGAGIHYSHELFHTTDGGLTWVSLDGEISDAYTGMVFADPTFGLRTYETTGAYEFGPPDYDITTDGGATWEHHELPPPPEAPGLFDQYPYCESYQPVLFSTLVIRILVGCVDYHYPPEQFTSYFYFSQDGGDTWQMVHLPDKVQADKYQMIYLSRTDALLLGRNIYMSTSDGLHWSFVQMVNWDAQFSFTDTQYGWAVGTGEDESALAQTRDAGASWSLMAPIIKP